ncbi:Uu.00g081500.m01.CDS01 [Anthostomella pinea]|uniref:Uu.00g081500.m01.CDS01 n=1 Tax=Anthostomella pinea TaxID=933095 RepID=A0AAI8VL81_9PEZI|nr:Uu.00g081500.m01.CDS01 [Anthostomella pinea]
MASSSSAPGIPVTLETPAPAPPAQSILEYLTVKNPDINHQEAGKSLTDKRQYWVPKLVKPWHEFEFNTMEKIFGRELMTECRRPRVMHHVFPPPHPERDLIEKLEDTTRWILGSWTIRMVNSALEPVEKSLNPVFWTAQSLAAPTATSVAPSLSSTGRATAGVRSQPKRRASSQNPAAETRPRRARSLVPDGTGLSHESLLALAVPTSETGNLGEWTYAGRLPKEIKPGTKWSSERLDRGQIVDQNGRWKEGQQWRNYSAPLRQIYTYCARAKSRYGCIVTSKEVVVVRIRPEKEDDGPAEEGTSGGDSSKRGDNLSSDLRSRGLMEWKSIKWSEHRREELVEEYRELTMNLALWIMHVLAGNDCEIKRRYDPLSQEEKRTSTISSPSPWPVPISLTSSMAYSMAESQQPQLREPRGHGNPFQDSFTSASDLGASFNSTASRKRRRESPDVGLARGRPRCQR